MVLLCALAGLASAWLKLSTEVPPEVAHSRDAERLQRVADAFTPALLDDKDLVIVVEDDAARAAEISAAARARQIPVNVADKPELCSFILPSIIDRSPIMVAVSSGWGMGPFP